MAKDKPLSIQEAMFADLVAAGLTLSDSYRRAFPDSKAQGASINVQASKLRNLDRVQQRINALQQPGEQQPVVRDQRLLSAEWMSLEIANGLYVEATSAAGSRDRIEAWKLLGQMRPINLFAAGSGGTTVNVQANQISAPSGSDADTLRYKLVQELQRSLPAGTSVLDGDCE